MVSAALAAAPKIAPEAFPKPQYFTAPSGRRYKWGKATPPTQDDLDAIVAYEKQVDAESKVKGNRGKVPLMASEPGNPEKVTVVNPDAAKANKKLENELIRKTTQGLARAGYNPALTPAEDPRSGFQKALVGESETSRLLNENAQRLVNNPVLSGIGNAFGEASGLTQALKLLGANSQADAVQSFLGSAANPANLTMVAPAMQAAANPTDAAFENYYNAFDDRLPWEQRIGPAINIALGIYALKGRTFPFKGRNIPVTPELREIVRTFRGNPNAGNLSEFADQMEAAWQRAGQKALPGEGGTSLPVNPTATRSLPTPNRTAIPVNPTGVADRGTRTILNRSAKLTAQQEAEAAANRLKNPTPPMKALPGRTPEPAPKVETKSKAQTLEEMAGPRLPKLEVKRVTEKQIVDTIAEYAATGRVVSRQPRKGTIMVNGRSMPEATAVAKMRRDLELNPPKVAVEPTAQPKPEAPSVVANAAEPKIETPAPTPKEPAAVKGKEPWEMTPNELIAKYGDKARNGPDYDRNIAATLNDLLDSIGKKEPKGIKHFGQVLKLKTKEWTFDEYQAASKPPPTPSIAPAIRPVEPPKPKPVATVEPQKPVVSEEWDAKAMQAIKDAPSNIRKFILTYPRRGTADERTLHSWMAERGIFDDGKGGGMVPRDALNDINYRLGNQLVDFGTNPKPKPLIENTSYKSGVKELFQSGEWWSDGRQMHKGPLPKGFDLSAKKPDFEKVKAKAEADSKFAAKEIAENHHMASTPRVVLESAEGHRTLVNQRFLETSRKIHGKDVEFYISDEPMAPVRVVKNGETVGVVMPMKADVEMNLKGFKPTPKTGLDAVIQAGEEASARLKKGGTGNKNRQRGASGITPEDLKDLTIVVAGRLAKGAKNFQEVAAYIKKEFPAHYEAFVRNGQKIYTDAKVMHSDNMDRVVRAPVKATKANVSTETKLGNPNEKAINEGVRDVQSGQGKGNEGKQPQGQGNGQKANAFQEKGQVTPESVGVKSAIEPTPAAVPTRTRASANQPKTSQAPTEAGLDRIVDTFDKAGSFRTPKDKDAGRRLWQARANAWANEGPGRNVDDFYNQFSAVVDQAASKGALNQVNWDAATKKAKVKSGKPPLETKAGNLAPSQKMASVAETGGLLQSGDPVKISFTNTDKARVGLVTLPDGATFYAQGGPNFRVAGHDPLAGVDTAAYASAKPGTAQRHHNVAAAGAELQFPINNADLNTLASNGILAIKASVKNAMGKRFISRAELFAHMKRAVTNYNGTDVGRSSPFPMPSSINEFMASLDSLNTFPQRKQFAQNFYSKSRKASEVHPFGSYEDVAKAINEPSFADRGANDITNALRVNPLGKTSKTTGHEIYPHSIEGVNFGKTTTGDIMEIVPKSFWDEIAALEKTRGKKYTDNQAKALIGQWLWFGNNKLAPGKILTVPAENVAKFFLQESKGVVKGWYDATTKTLGAFTGKSDFSTFVHESFHAWTDSLKPEHVATLERQFGKVGTTEYFERSARAFERYLRDGVAPTESLRGVFSTIKDAMVRIYSKIKGSPIEEKVHADVKTVFDEMLGGGNAKPSSTRTRASKAEPTPVAPTAGEPPIVAPPKQTTTPSAEPQTTGVSNRAQLSDAEKGLLMEDPKGKGRSAEDIYNANRNRTDYQNVAAEVAKGRPFSSDDAAAVIAGNRTLTAKVKDAADELDHAINNKQSQSIIDQRREALRSALEEKQQFVDNIQKGKSQWSDTGRVFGLDTRIDNGDIGQVLGEARRWKGSDLNSKEVAQLTKAVEEHARRVKVVEAELKAAQEKIAEKVTQNMRAKAGPRPTPDRIADIRKRRADASQRLSRSFGQMNLGIPTETVGAIYDIAKTYVEEYGIVKPQELIKRMRDDHAALKDISDADILESIATAGNPGRVAKTRSEVAQNLAQLRKEAAAAMGNPEKIKAINAKIADLEDQISTGNFKMPKARTKAAPGSELELAQIRLQESRARVNAAIRAREPKSAGQKVAGFLRETALANPIARLQDLNSNLWSAADNATWSPIDRALANRISKSAGGEGVAGRVGWNKTRNERVFRNYGASIKAEMAGSNSKFLSDGHYLKPSTWAGATDAPFRVAYERGAWSDLADSFAKRTGKDSESAFRQLVNEEYTPGPMNHADWKAGREAGTKIADRLTYNNENPASALSSKVKEAIRHYQKHGTPSQQATAQYMEPAVDNILRFSKVIYNVAADRLQRSGSGVLKGASRHIRGIRAAEAMTTEEAMYIARLYRKGATGALTTYAAYLYAKYQMPDGQTGSQHFPGELVKTKSGKVYVDFGSFEQIAVFAPILFGVGIARLEKLPTHDGKTDPGGEGVTESQKKDAWLNMLTDLVTNQPLFSGPERIIKATQSESGMKGYAASVALGAIPGASAIRGIANLVDESKGIRYRSAQTPMDKAKLLLPWWMRDEVAPAENKLPERLRK